MGNAGRCPRWPTWRRGHYFPALLLALGTSGCFRYVPVAPQSVSPDDEVRVRVSESAAVRLVPELGGYTGTLEGQLTRQGQDSLALAIPIGREYQGVILNKVRQTLVLAPGEVVEVRRREFSRRNTLLAAAGAVAGFVVVALSIEQLRDPNQPKDENPPPPPSNARFHIWLGAPGRK